jgi:integrase
MAGKGSLIEKKGKWYLVVNINDGGGNYRKKWLPLAAKTEAEAIKERNLTWADRERDEWIEPKKITINDCFDRWIKHLKERPKPAGRRTIEEYTGAYQKHIKDTLGNVLIQKLTAKQVRELIESKDSPFKARRVYDILNTMINLVYRDGDTRLKENVCGRLTPPVVKGEGKEHKTWNADQCKKFLKEVRCQRYYGVFLTAMTTGMRIGEVLGLRWQDADLKKKIISVEQKLEKKETGNPVIQVGDPKTKASKASLLMTDILAAELERIKQQQKFERNGYKEQYKELDFVFTNTVGGPVALEDLRDRVFNPTIKRIQTEYMLPKIRIHDLRHSAATLLRSLGIDIKTIQRYLRHADLSATQIYTHDDNVEFLRDATEKMNEALK